MGRLQPTQKCITERSDDVISGQQKRVCVCVCVGVCVWLVAGAPSQQYEQVEEDGDDVQIQDERGKDILLWAQTVLLPPHHQLAVHRQELREREEREGEVSAGIMSKNSYLQNRKFGILHWNTKKRMKHNLGCLLTVFRGPGKGRG